MDYAVTYFPKGVPQVVDSEVPRQTIMGPILIITRPLGNQGSFGGARIVCMRRLYFRPPSCPDGRFAHAGGLRRRRSSGI